MQPTTHVQLYTTRQLGSSRSAAAHHAISHIHIGKISQLGRINPPQALPKDMDMAQSDMDQGLAIFWGAKRLYDKTI